MTIEEKAKAYDEALERAKLYHRNELAGTRQEMTEYIFPELRESENGRVRIALIKMISDIDGGYPFEKYGITKKDALNWFEKQKEQKPAEWNEEDEKKILFLERLIKYHVPEGRYGYIDKSVTKLQAIAILKSLRPQPKQEWSEKDERTLIHIQSHLKYLIEHRFKIKDYNTMEDRMILESEIKWLENRFKYLCPVKQEWSENDKRILYNVIAYVGYAAGERGVKDDDFKEANEWLKNLRSQPHWKKSLTTADLENSLCDLQDNYHDGSYEYKIIGEAIEFIRCTELRPSWKPSKEQMKALEQAKISAVAGNYITKDGLCSLYEQLKKL